jgi:carbohydrate kinase (thermoresistant glucokinase family)
MIYLFMGVSGCGKTTAGQLFAKKNGLKFIDADDLHSPENRQKMSSGKPLCDADRKEWLNKINSVLFKSPDTVIACSALKQKYRDKIFKNITGYKLIFLQINYNEAMERIKNRRDHFFPLQLLQSQFDTLETPENAINIDARLSPEKIISMITGRHN